MNTTTRLLSSFALAGSLTAFAPAAFAQAAATPAPAASDSAAAEVASFQTSTEEKPWTGFQIGLRTGFGFGVGDVYKGLALGDASNGAIPIILDLGYRITPNIHVSVYGEYAFVLTKTNPVSCPTGFSCTVGDIRVGVSGEYHLKPQANFDPFIGVGVGYEILTSNVSGNNVPVPLPQGGTVPATVTGSATDHGFEFANLTLGADFRVAPKFTIGGFFLATVGQYGSHSLTQTITVTGVAPQTVNGPAVQQSPHALFVLGPRGTFNL